MQDVTFFQWTALVLGILGFLGTWTAGIIGITRAVSAIKLDTSEKISCETDKITGRLNELSERFESEQRAQDQNFGEVGLSVRQYISSVEKEMHQIEIWGRDNFVLKSEFATATESIRTDIRTMAADIRTDLRTLTAKIDAKN